MTMSNRASMCAVRFRYQYINPWRLQVASSLVESIGAVASEWQNRNALDDGGGGEGKGRSEKLYRCCHADCLGQRYQG